MDQRQRVAENQGEEDANMVTAVEDTRLLDRDVTMVRETETPRPATAPHRNRQTDGEGKSESVGTTSPTQTTASLL